MGRILLGFGIFVLALACVTAQFAAAAPGGQREDYSAQRRPQVTIYPSHRVLGPNAKRYCRGWLATEYRVSGPVIVPRRYCWWQ